jgi:hypothetical protein
MSVVAAASTAATVACVDAPHALPAARASTADEGATNASPPLAIAIAATPRRRQTRKEDDTHEL